MKRVILSVTGTVFGLVGLLSFKSHAHPLVAAGPLPSAGTGGGSTATTAPSGAKSSSPSSSAGAKGGASAAATKRTVAGEAVDTQYGTVQVQVNLTGSHIDNVQFLQLTAFDGRSQEINSAAAPILLQETLSAQNANIDVVSGASYTSEGYIQSLQSALDKAGVR